MKYRKLPGIDIPVSSIIFGCCNPILVKDQPGAEALLDLAFSKGFNTFDAAKVYGRSEEVLGRWIKKSGNRKDVVIITKGCHPDPASRMNVKALKEDVESSLERLRTDHIDIYMLHRDDPDADMASIIEELNGYMRAGVIKKIGASNWTCERIGEANAYARKHGLEGFTVSSPQMSLARMVKDPWGGGCVSISWDESSYRWYSKHPEVAVMAYSCLANGMFSGKIDASHPFLSKRKLSYAARAGYWCRENVKRLRAAESIAEERGRTVAQIAVSWCMSHDFTVFPIATVSSGKRMLENIEAADTVLDKADMDRLRCEN